MFSFPGGPMRISLSFLCLFSLTTYAQVFSVPWANPLACARHVGQNERGELVINYAYYSSYARGLAETIAIFQRLHGNPGLRLSLEHLQYTMGQYRVMRSVEYAPDCESFPTLDEDTQRLLDTQRSRPLVADDFGGPNWVHMISAIGQDELVCLNYVDRGDAVSGCGDVWQSGLTAEEVVCHRGKTYLKCHVDCITRLNRSTPELQPGFCP